MKKEEQFLEEFYSNSFIFIRETFSPKLVCSFIIGGILGFIYGENIETYEKLLIFFFAEIREFLEEFLAGIPQKILKESSIKP